MNKTKDGKITLGMIKGKPLNTSVPSIRFHANVEEIEELYKSEDESINNKQPPGKSKNNVVGDVESSPLRYLRLGKRSSSIDNSLTLQDSSPPSDPWKFFTEIKGKITKSVEDRITEIKHRSQDGESNLKKGKSTKEKDNSSLSDSEDISESSLSKTCGFMSTTEGVEMSSDDETPSIERDKKSEDISKMVELPLLADGARNRFKLRRRKDDSITSVSIKGLKNLYELSTGVKPLLKDDKNFESGDITEVESGVEAFEDTNLQASRISESESERELTSTASDIKHKTLSDEEFMSNVANKIFNVEVDDSQCLNIQKVSGSELRNSFLDDSQSHTYFSPEGFVDLRKSRKIIPLQENLYNYRQLIILFLILLIYYFLVIPVYLSGFIAGASFTFCLCLLYNKLFNSNNTLEPNTYTSLHNNRAIHEITPIKEHQPIAKFEGWMNEFPDHYDPQNYHISQTQSVYVKVQGNFLRISHTRAKIPKRAMWNEPKHKLVFVQHRIYNLLNAKVMLLPTGLSKKRQWSKKYPICILLNKDQSDVLPANQTVEDEDCHEDKKGSNNDEGLQSKRSFFSRKKHIQISPQIFSKLTEEEDEIESSGSRHSSPSPQEERPSPDISEEKQTEDEIDMTNILKDEDDDDLSWTDWNTISKEDADSTHIYLFGRTSREKEDWYRRLVMATHKDMSIEEEKQINQVSFDSIQNEDDYHKYMLKLQKLKTSIIQSPADEINVLWINTLIGRILYDFTRSESFTAIVKERVQKKLSSIKVPYFIEQLIVTDLSLGNNSPIFHKVNKPTLDHRGLWIDLDMIYEGNIVLLLQTKLNLMKLKYPDSSSEDINRTAKWQNSDLEDTAESSTDDELHIIPSIKMLDDFGHSTAGGGGTTNSSKKFIRIVDKIAESKIFQAATENRYIKKAMEGVSNTELGLKVEIKGLIGTLVLNIPPPPTDRLWVGFRPTPKLFLSAHPIIGERNISFLRQLTSWIEKKLSQEFQKVLVIPNMEDIIIPVMSQKLPE